MMQRSQWEEETSGPRMNLPRVPCTSDNSTTSTAPLLQLHQNLQHTQRASKNIVEYDLCRSISPHYSRFTNGTHTITWTPLISSLSLSADNKQPSVYIVITKYQPKNQPNINFLWQFFHYYLFCWHLREPASTNTGSLRLCVSLCSYQRRNRAQASPLKV